MNDVNYCINRYKGLADLLRVGEEIIFARYTPLDIPRVAILVFL